MKKHILIPILAMLLALGNEHPIAAQGLEIVTPTNQNKERVRIYSGEKATYHQLSKRNTLAVKVKGKGELMIISRLRLNRESLGTSYTLAYTFDDNKKEFYKKHSIGKTASGVDYYDRSIKERASVLRKWEISIPKGIKTVNVFIRKNGGHTIDATFNYRSKSKFTDKKWVKIKPIDAAQDSVALLIGHRRTFYSLAAKKHTTIKVKGPGKLYVFSRTEYQEDENKQKPYDINYKMDNKLIKTKSYKYTSPSEKALYANKKKNAIPSGLKKFAIKIPPGEHSISFFTGKAQQKVDAYFRFKKEVKPSWAPLALYEEKTASVLQVVGQEKQLSYARISKEEQVKIKVSGKTKLRVFVRPEFEYYMHSDNVIRMAVFRDGVLLNTFRLSATRSKQVEYKDKENQVPGTLNKVYLDVPKGDHEYTFVLKDSDKSALIRISYDQNAKTLRKIASL